MLKLQNKDELICPVVHDHFIDCMDLWELACGYRGIPQDQGQRLGVLALREERRSLRLRRFYHLLTHWMLADQLTKYTGYVSKTLMELITSGHWTIEGSVRVRQGFGTEPTEKHVHFEEDTIPTIVLASQTSQDKMIEIPRDRISNTDILQCLRQLNVRQQDIRANVRQKGVAKIASLALGLVHDFRTGPSLSTAAQEWINLTRLLSTFFHQRQSAFRFTTIQVNFHFQSRLHVDGRNAGPSWIIALGEYTGGQLFVMDDDGDTTIVVKDEVIGRHDIAVGSRLRGRLHNIRHRWHKFNGNVPHMTMPYKGERFSLVYYNFGFRRHVEDNIKSKLKTLGLRP